MLESIIQAGYQEALPDYLRKRVKPTNIVALLLLIAVAIPFAIITPIYFPKILILIPLSGIITCIGVLLANQMGGIKYSRFFLSLLPVTQATLYNLFLCGPSDDPIPSVHLISLAFSLVPFVTFDLKERNALLFSSLYSFILIAVFPFTRDWVTLKADVSILREGWLSTITIVLGILTAFGCMVGLAFISRYAEEETEASLIKAEEKNQELLTEREENIRKTKALEEAQENERKQQWISNGISKISEIIRVRGNDEAIFDAILQNLIKYLKVIQGGLFVVDLDEGNPEDTRIHLAACYAYERKKYVSREVHPGEGMLGQAYLEKMLSYYHEVPEGYVNITSGLGQAQPRCLLIVPLMVNDVVEGLIELASFQALEDYQQTFVEQVGEVIAAYIQSNRNVRRMQDLLGKAQEQAEELSAQEEEIRQNMEEMQATHEHHERTMEEMQRERDELLEKIAGLEGQKA